MKKHLTGAALAIVLATAMPAAAQTGAHTGHSGHGATSEQTADMLASSSPANNAVLPEAPRRLTLTFAHAVVLQTVAITGPGDTPVRATFQRPQNATTGYSIALPALGDGAYHVRWTASGGGHQMSGELHFTVE